MLRRALLLGCVLAGSLAGLAPARADEDMRVAEPFLQAMIDSQLYDLANDYLEQLRADPNTPPDLKATIDYRLGRIMKEEGAKSGDLVRRKELFDQSRGKMATFVDKNPTHPKVPEASVALAGLLVERGHLAMLTAGELDPKEKKEKEAKLQEARAAFDEARTAYEKADKILEAKFKTFPNYLPENDPNKAVRDKTHADLMDAQLQKALVDYEQGQTYDPGSKERKDSLNKGLVQFEELYKKYRTQWAGLTAQMFQGKCYEESGDPADIGKALGIYNQLLAHEDPRLRPLQKNVAFFKIIAERKREQYALAADDCVRWLNRYNQLADLRSEIGLGVRLEKAKNILAQIPTALNEAEKKQMIDAAVDDLKAAVRMSSRYKPEALELLKKYKPNIANDLGKIAKLSYEDAMTQAEQALGAKEYDNAAPVLKHAIRQATKLKDIDKVNNARYYLAFCYYMNKQYYEAAVLCEHLAKRYPRFGLAPKSASVAMASLADAYNTYVDYDQRADLNNLVEMAKYTAEAFPDTDEGDTARTILGQIHHGTGRYTDAIAAYESVRAKSGKWVDARTKVGASHWEQSRLLRAKGGPDADKLADAEVQLALDRLQEALKARQEAGNPPTDVAVVGNICDIAEIYLDTDRPQDALKLLDPVVKAQKPTDTLPFKRLMTDEMRAHILTDQVDPALGDMAAIEKVGTGGGGLAQLYFGLGKLLEKEMQRLKEKGDSAGLAQKQASFLKFLNALATSKSGQTYESLQWVGENMLKLGKAQEATDVFKRIMDSFGKDEAFVTKSPDMIYRTNVKLAAALREQKQWSEAEALVSKLRKEHEKAIEPRLEEAMLHEGKAASGVGKWNEAFAWWNQLGQLLSTGRPKRPEYYDAMYHAGYCKFKSGDSIKALQLLKGTLRLSPTLGNDPDMKKKYQSLIAQIERTTKQAALPQR